MISKDTSSEGGLFHKLFGKNEHHQLRRVLHFNMSNMWNFSQVKIIFGDKDSSNPRCVHGPTLLMERGTSRFYACAAYRSRKDCDFYLAEGEALSQVKKTRIKEAVKQLLDGRDHGATYSKVRKAVEGNQEVRLCQGCDKVVDEEVCCGETIPITKKMLSRPSTFLVPKVTITRY